MKALFPVRPTGNAFFYLFSLVKNNSVTTFFIIMLFFVAVFNTTSAGNALSVFAVQSFEADTIDADGNTDVYQAHAAVRTSGREAIVDASESGQGGVDDFFDSGEEDYPTTWDDALVADLAPLSVDQNQVSRDQIVYYVVENGDTVSDIARQYDISPSTLLWANNLSSANYIKAGQRLEILPTDGVKYEVKKNDTLGALAKKFKAAEDDIIAYNHLPADGALRPGDMLIVPNGVMPSAPRPAPAQPPAYAQKGSLAPQISSNKYFIFPTTGRRSQGLHGYNGVDIANQCGTPIYAAADGVVTSLRTTTSRARVGSSVFSGYGNHVKITHPNGVTTLYAHLKDLYVFEGQEVKQGSMIATMGGGFEYVNGRLVRMEGSGRSTGCHLHFEVRGARNPLLSQTRY